MRVSTCDPVVGAIYVDCLQVLNRGVLALLEHRLAPLDVVRGEEVTGP